LESATCQRGSATADDVSYGTNTRSGPTGTMNLAEWLLSPQGLRPLLVNWPDVTIHFTGERELRLTKPTAVLVNVARAEIVDEAALYLALVRERSPVLRSTSGTSTLRATTPPFLRTRRFTSCPTAHAPPRIRLDRGHAGGTGAAHRGQHPPGRTGQAPGKSDSDIGGICMDVPETVNRLPWLTVLTVQSTPPLAPSWLEETSCEAVQRAVSIFRCARIMGSWAGVRSLKSAKQIASVFPSTPEMS
jgi:hypothetical protein